MRYFWSVCVFLCAVWVFPGFVMAQPSTSTTPTIRIKIQSSETLSLVYMAQSILGESSHSPYLRQVYVKHAAMYKLDARWLAQLRRSLDVLPPSIAFYTQLLQRPRRQHGQNMVDVLEIFALQSKSLADFEQRTRPLMPVGSQKDLIDALKRLEPLHRKHVWQPSQVMLKAAQAQLIQAQQQHKVGQFLQRVSTFYGSAWPSTTPVTIALVPVPGTRKTTLSFAHSAGAYEIVEVHQQSNMLARLGVLVHEICHSLFDAQPLARQRQIDQWFYGQRTLAAHLAYQEINEAVATALGNGLFEKLYRPKNQQRKIWYNDPVIDKYAKAIFPFIREYMKKGSGWDKSLTEKMVGAFKVAFPNYQQDVRFVFQSTSLFLDDPTKKIKDIRILPRLFRRVSKFWFSSPMTHARAKQNYNADPNSTAVFLLTKPNTKPLTSYSFFAPHLSSLSKWMATGKPFIFASRGNPPGRLHVVIWMGKQPLTTPFYKKIQSLKVLPVDNVIWLK